MAKVTLITEQFQHFVQDLKQSFWGEVYGQTGGLWKKFLEEESQRQQASYLGSGSTSRPRKRGRITATDFINGFGDPPGGARRLRQIPPFPPCRAAERFARPGFHFSAH
jgi:hypothetical protein